jgi:tetratricopeptide (TPR) repeat protein
LNKFPESCPCQANRIRKLLALNKIKTAEMAAFTMIGKCPDKPEGFLSLGRVMLKQGRTVEAYYILMDARQKSQTGLSLEDLLHIARLQEKLGYLKASRETMAQIRRKWRKNRWANVQTRLLESRILMKEGKISDALIQITAAVQQAPDDESALVAAMSMYLRLGAYRKGLDIAQRLYKLTGKTQYKRKAALFRERLQKKLLNHE